MRPKTLVATGRIAHVLGRRVSASMTMASNLWLKRTCILAGLLCLIFIYNSKTDTELGKEMRANVAKAKENVAAQKEREAKEEAERTAKNVVRAIQATCASAVEKAATYD